ncbi:hypothetical protein [Bacillus sp. CRN 9]|uniref:hypothetical protein n=1 Tax=Cytobacillus horneckiae TaxID=549687 RepID=UPI001562B96C|nr:hypothetical protein [Bacillus sp. CRN 9]
MKRILLKAFIMTNLIAISIFTPSMIEETKETGIMSKADFGQITPRSKADFG